MDRDGYLYFDGRKDNVYNIHGRKVSAVKIENALNSLPQVQEAAVIFQNNALRAHVVLPAPNAPGQDALHWTIKRQLNDYLESWEIPRDIIFHKNLPKNNSGKTVKGLLSAKE
ncbi:MAG: AMP-binding enzyme [Enterocloster sp.]